MRTLVAALFFLVSLVGFAGQAQGQEVQAASPPNTSTNIEDATTGPQPLVLYSVLDWGSFTFDLRLASCDTSTSCGTTPTVLASNQPLSFDGLTSPRAQLLDSPGGSPVVGYLDPDLDVRLIACGDATCSTRTEANLGRPPGTNPDADLGLALDPTNSSIVLVWVSRDGVFAGSCETASCPAFSGWASIDGDGASRVDVAETSGRLTVATQSDDGSTLTIYTCTTCTDTGSWTSNTVTVGQENPLPLVGPLDVALDDNGVPSVLTTNGVDDPVIVRCGDLACGTSALLSLPDGKRISDIAHTADGLIAFGRMDQGGIHTARCGAAACEIASFPILTPATGRSLLVLNTAPLTLLHSQEGTVEPQAFRCPDATCDTGSSASPLSIAYQGLSESEGLVARLYPAYFNRDPDAGGFQFWLDAIGSGTWENSRVSAFFSTSPEFRDLYGDSVTDAEFLELVYRNVFDRLPDDGGSAYWLERLGTDLTRGEVMLFMSDSPEFRQRTRTR